MELLVRFFFPGFRVLSFLPSITYIACIFLSSSLASSVSPSSGFSLERSCRIFLLERSFVGLYIILSSVQLARSCGMVKVLLACPTWEIVLYPCFFPSPCVTESDPDFFISLQLLSGFHDVCQYCGSGVPVGKPRLHSLLDLRQYLLEVQGLQRQVPRLVEGVQIIFGLA